MSTQPYYATFEAFLAAMDDLLAPLGVTTDDLPDYLYRDAYDSGALPEDIIENVLINADVPEYLINQVLDEL